MEYQGTSRDGYTARELREIDSAIAFSECRARDMAAVIDEVENMNWFQRTTESLVPGETYKDIILEIDRHRKLYEEIKEAFLKVRNRDENAGEVLEYMYEMLMQLCTEDKRQKKQSKFLCELYQNFVAEKDKLENSIRKVDCVHSRMQLSRTQMKLDVTMEKVDDLMREVRQSEMQSASLLDKTQTLMEQNKQMLDGRIKDDQELEKCRNSYRSLEEKFDRVLTMNKLLVDREREKEKECEEEKKKIKEKEEEWKKEREEEKNRDQSSYRSLEKKFDTALAKNKQLEEELERGRSSYRSLEEKFDMVLAKNKQLELELKRSPTLEEKLDTVLSMNKQLLEREREKEREREEEKKKEEEWKREKEEEKKKEREKEEEREKERENDRVRSDLITTLLKKALERL